MTQAGTNLDTHLATPHNHLAVMSLWTNQPFEEGLGGSSNPCQQHIDILLPPDVFTSTYAHSGSQISTKLCRYNDRGDDLQRILLRGCSAEFVGSSGASSVDDLDCLSSSSQLDQPLSIASSDLCSQEISLGGNGSFVHDINDGMSFQSFTSVSDQDLQEIEIMSTDQQHGWTGSLIKTSSKFLGLPSAGVCQTPRSSRKPLVDFVCRDMCDILSKGISRLPTKRNHEACPAGHNAFHDSTPIQQPIETTNLEQSNVTEPVTTREYDFWERDFSPTHESPLPDYIIYPQHGELPYDCMSMDSSSSSLMLDLARSHLSPHVVGNSHRYDTHGFIVPSRLSENLSEQPLHPCFRTRRQKPKPKPSSSSSSPKPKPKPKARSSSTSPSSTSSPKAHRSRHSSGKLTACTPGTTTTTTPLPCAIRKRRRPRGASTGAFTDAEVDALGFVNFTLSDGSALMTGVAPSGSSKTKARREKEASERRVRMGQAAMKAVAAAGGDVDKLLREGFTF